MACTSHEARKSVAAFTSCVPGFNVTECDEAGLTGLLADVRKAPRCLDGLVMRIGVRANQLAREGRSAPVEETIRGNDDSSVGTHQAQREAKRAKVSEDVVGLGDAVAKGEASGDHVDSIARHTSKLSNEQRASFNFDGLVAKAKSMPADDFDRLVKRRVDNAMCDHGLADANEKRSASEFRHWFDHKTGMGSFAGILDPERYEALTNAVEHQVNRIAAASNCDREPISKSHSLAAEALVQLVTATGKRDARGRLPSVTIVVDHDTIVRGGRFESVRQTENGHDIPPETIARLCCDAVVRRVTLDEHGVPINVGRKYRTATDAQWAAIKAVHSGCAWDGCTAHINWCQAHHIREWDDGGPTDLDNLVPLCNQNHHRVHEGGWYIKMLPERTLKTYKPDGSHHTTVNPPMRR